MASDGPPPYQPLPNNYQQSGGYGTQPPPPPTGYSDPGKYQGYPQPQGYQSYQNQSTVTVQQQPQVVIVGGCPACRMSVLEDDYTCLGVCCAILFFPLGILCCLAMKQRRCPNCGAIFD